MDNIIKIVGVPYLGNITTCSLTTSPFLVRDLKYGME
jgi:hypothetical protein